MEAGVESEMGISRSAEADLRSKLWTSRPATRYTPAVEGSTRKPGVPGPWGDPC